MKPDESIPPSVATAFVGVTVAGIAVGLLAGAGLVSGGALAAFILGALAVFIPWGVWQLDPETLSQADAYSKEKSLDEDNS
jgi:hypothetical protein